MEYGKFLTEQVNERSAGIDKMSALEMVTLINEEDHKIADAVQAVLPQIAEAAEAIAARLRDGGRLIYVGAGTSGRLGIIDAAECPPTYGVDPEMVQCIMAGGRDAVFQAVENAEDDGEASVRAMRELAFSKKDVCFGISASGSAAFVRGALAYARSLGALDITLCCNPSADVCREVSIAITPAVGAEVISGSTRMKAATAQKMVLTAVSTSVMVLLGRVQGNRMTYMRASNKKLVERSIRMVRDLTGADEETAKAALQESGNHVERAVQLIRGT